ncbi:hypothetical protein PFZ55_54545 [Streptomyces sp. MS2A]|nr:hypothetical protein [Streptomyces sp. MS2A]
MTNNPMLPLVPEDPDDEGIPEAVLREEDGRETLDPDAADELVDSAEADRIAAEGVEG